MATKRKSTSGYTIQKSGDNYALRFNGLSVESGIFATRAMAEKHKRLAEYERAQRLRASNPVAALGSTFVRAKVRRLPNGRIHLMILSPPPRKQKRAVRRRKR